MKTFFILAAFTFLLISFICAIFTLGKDNWKWVITTWGLLSVGITFTLLTIYS